MSLWCQRWSQSQTVPREGENSEGKCKGWLGQLKFLFSFIQITFDNHGN